MQKWVLGGALVAAGLLFGASAHAKPRCPEGMWSSGGSCCGVGQEYTPAKNQCAPVRPERRCVAGHLDDCVSAGRELQTRGANGAGYAAELYRYACEEGHAPACRSLGALYQQGLGLDRDEERARALYEESCYGGDAPGCTMLARVMLDETKGGGEQALELLTQACHRGDPNACDYYAEHLARDPGRSAESAEYFQRACEGGVGRACRQLLETERRGHDVAPARERALLEAACGASDAEGCSLLGDALRDGVIAPQSSVQAAARYRVACEAGYLPGCMRLAELTLEGNGVMRDLGRAEELYTRACGAGVRAACERATWIESQRQRERTRSAQRSP